jgi:hypothetical protein
MGPGLLLAVYLAPAGFVLVDMIKTRSFSVHHISSLGRLPKRVTLAEWLAVYGYLGTRLESRNQPPGTKPGRPWRLIGSGVAFAISLVLFQVTLPMNVPVSFAQQDWNAFPVMQAAIAGGALASSLVLAFHRARRWHLVEHHTADYPYLEWGALKCETAKVKGKTA